MYTNPQLKETTRERETIEEKILNWTFNIQVAGMLNELLLIQ
jgi:hypothetical protein